MDVYECVETCADLMRSYDWDDIYLRAQKGYIP